MSDCVYEYVYKSRDNINIVNFSDQDGIIDFSAATRMLVQFDGSTVVADTDVDPTLIDFSLGSGDVSFKFGGLSVDVGEYPASVIVFDGSHPNGQTLVHAKSKLLIFNFREPIL